MKKVLITINNNTLIFSYNNVKTDETKMLNTNVINNNKLLFTDEYIVNNTKIVSLFIKELCKEKNITKVNVEVNDLALLVLSVIKNNPLIEHLCLLEDVSLPYEICEKIVKNKFIKYLNCYNVPTFMIDLLDKNGIIVKSRIELFFTSDFMQGNNLNEFSTIYYKLSIRIRFPLNKDEKEDINTFFKINRYLQTIHINKADKDDIDYIVNILKSNKVSNIKIVIHSNITNEKTVEYLKKINRKYKRRYRISFGLKYSNEYLKNNVFNQLLVNILKICGFIIFSLIVFVSGYILITNYTSMKEVTKIQENISKKIKEDEKNNVIPTEPSNNNDKVITNPYIASLLSINPNTVAWVNVKNTNIDYSVLQTVDNDYYLKHNFNDEEDQNGWIFMDYRNNTIDLDKNTILYGHNRYYSGIMFGTLYKMQEKKWYTNKDNLIITLSTLYDTYEFEIFSTYKIPKTSDYLQIKFDNNTEWQSFIKMLRDRSIAKFDAQVGNDDKILTLSTCSYNNTRLVVHAVLKNS
ncbi:MAG: class B sortase [Bacilli bacterium]|nr:class B sortase [Bacilli bacterium]